MEDVKRISTEAGLIPEDWNVSTLGEAFKKIEAGVSVNSDERLASKYYVLKTSSVHDGIVDISESKPVVKADYYRLKCPLQRGSIVISRMNTPELVGAVGYNAEDHKDVFLPDRLWQITADEDAEFDFRWLSYLLNLPKYRDAVRSTATGTSNSMKNISKDRLTEVSIPKPDLEEQILLAGALYDMDELISNLTQLIIKKQNIRRGTIQHLITGKQRLPGFNAEWKEYTLGEECRVYGGGTPSTKNDAYWRGHIPWVSSSDLVENDIFSLSETRFITADAINESATQLCPPNSILVVSRVGVGKIAVCDHEVCTSQDFTNLFVENHNPIFVAYRLLPIMKEMARTAQGTSIKGVTSDDIRAIKLLLPEEDEQNAVVEILKDMDDEITQLKETLDKYLRIKIGMMDELLTGKIRLV